MPDRTRKKSETPPINELVMGVSFVPVSGLKAQHIGIYWDIVKKRFPICDQQPPVMAPASIPGAVDPSFFREMPGEIFPLPRFWFSSKPESTLLQIQRDMFMLNWRKGGSNIYPHYETVADDFWREILIFEKFLKERVGESIKAVNQCELNYINLVDHNTMFSTQSELKNIIPSISGLCDTGIESARLEGLNSLATYRINANLKLDVAVRIGVRADTKATVAILELRALGAPNELSLDAARAWYDAAHDVTHDFFLRFTSEAAQSVLWKPI
jgi:uncharacterized protein (TIGR04255 family)